MQTPQGLVPLGFGKLTNKCAMEFCSGYCLTQIPELQNVEIVGAMAHPDFDPKKKSYYIQLAEDWNEQLTMKL